MRCNRLSFLCVALSVCALLTNWLSTYYKSFDSQRLIVAPSPSDLMSMSPSPLPPSPLPPPPPLPPSPLPPRVVLLSAGRPVRASARGNLAPVQVVTRIAQPEATKQAWLTDRWQAASDMNGRPIPGAQWVAIELAAGCVASEAKLDWESAHADDYDLQVARVGDNRWETLETRRNRSTSKQHVVDTLRIVSSSRNAEQARMISASAALWEYRVLIRRPATQWGVSLWRVELWGHCSGAARRKAARRS